WGHLNQRNTFNAFVESPLSPRTRVSLTLRVGSGFPLPGYFEGRRDGLYAGTARNSVRLPSYARLDLRADRTFKYRRSRLTLFGEVINVLNRTNYAPDYGGFVASGQAISFTAKQF